MSEIGSLGSETYMPSTRQKLIGLLDYVEQVVRLDERVAFRVSDYRLPDGSSFSLTPGDTRNLPSVRHDLRDEDGATWLEVERLARKEPPPATDDIAEWLVITADPLRSPEVRQTRIVTASAAERDLALSGNAVRSEDVLEAPRIRGEPTDAPTRFDLTYRLEDRPEISEKIEAWVRDVWIPWSIAEQPRRKTIALYQVLYKVFQLLEVGGAESSIELVWGIGVVNWQKDGRILDRALIERRAEMELDDRKGGLLRVRPTANDAVIDLRPYDELGCANLASLSDMFRREIHLAAEVDGVSPFARESFESILTAAGARLDPDGVYAPEPNMEAHAKTGSPARLTVTDQWILFARPRSQHVVLQDLDRLRRATENEQEPISGLARRLVTPPSEETVGGGWEPLSPHIGGTSEEGGSTSVHDEVVGDIFFPKPFNDDQVEIVRRLSRADGLVVQGPPGTGKTHTIANLICHAMATGQRVLVVSRGEAALAVLKEQLPKEIQSLAISVLSSEREGLRQVESAIREIQSVVEGTSGNNRRATIARLEKELQGVQRSLATTDAELDAIASQHLAPLGPRGESPAEVAQRIVRERDVFAWFTDRPTRFASEVSVTDEGVLQLRDARRRSGTHLEHLDADLPSAADLPDGAALELCHVDLLSAAALARDAASGPARTTHISPDNVRQLATVFEALDAIPRAHDACAAAPWAERFLKPSLLGEQDVWFDRLRERAQEWTTTEGEWAALLTRAADLPEGILDDNDACEAIARGAGGQRLWPRLALGKSASRARITNIRLDGAPVAEHDREGWRFIAQFVACKRKLRTVSARWSGFAREIGAPAGEDNRIAVDTARTLVQASDSVSVGRDAIAVTTGNTVLLSALIDDPTLCRALRAQLQSAVDAARLAGAKELQQRTLQLFQGDDRSSKLARKVLGEAVGNPAIARETIGATWSSLLHLIGQIKALAPDFETIRRVTSAIETAGAPQWAEALKHTPFDANNAPDVIDWRSVWDHGAAQAALERIDARERLSELTRQRGSADAQCRRLFGEIVRERTFFALDKRLSNSIKAALVEFVRALARIGRGTGKNAGMHRHAARDAMARCYAAVPCWIMPTWRVAEQLPAELGAVELVIIDEASQSDITELPALLRGKKIVVVGDDRQVSPTAPFVTQEKVNQLRHHYLDDMPFKSLLEPGESIYDLMRAVFPDQRLMLKEHFRCVEPIIRFSMQFYPETMLPLRIPSAVERLDPPLIDLYVPHGARGKKKTNPAEADVIVAEISAIATNPAMRERTIGVISLVGREQAEHIRAKLSETLGEEIMQRHGILCGDSATFQGSERDIVFLSMVADPKNKSALTMLRYEQRFNVAVSRARDRLFLVRSVTREELNPNDLKARLIAHFENPMPQRVENPDALSMCESDFERHVMGRLLKKGYRVTGQVGALGYRIDMVVEGHDGARLAVECDGDRYHGPQQWQQDMRRQRTLERVGWRFWRCFASNYYRDTDGVLNDLYDTLSRMGIHPLATGETRPTHRRLTEHRTVRPSASEPGISVRLAAELDVAAYDGASRTSGGIGIGDRIVIVFSDDQKRLAVQLVDGSQNLEKGRLSMESPLGCAVLGAEEGDQIDLVLENGIQRTVLIESVLPRAAALSAPTLATMAPTS
jgi:very-short-patch-repair endonuclease